jgi:DNA-binding transcriptional LysR family regulator
VGHVKGIFVASPKFLHKFGSTTPTVEDLQNLPCLAFGRAGTVRDVTVHRNARSQRFTIAPRISSGSMLGLYELAIAGQGIALIPDFICGDALEDGRLIQILKGWHTEVKAVSFITPPRQQLPSLVSAFIEFSLPKLRPHFS